MHQSVLLEAVYNLCEISLLLQTDKRKNVTSFFGEGKNNPAIGVKKIDGIF